MDAHTCAVCGDKAPCYRLYGATTVCYSCRIFFRRTVKGRQKLNCLNAEDVLCSFDKLTRNKCRKCRYDKCLEVGMNPLLVDSCKQTKINEQQRSAESTVIVTNHANIQRSLQSEDMATRNISKEIQIDTPVDSSLSRCTKENLSQSYEQVFDSIILNPQGEYLKEIFEVEKSVYEQARSKKGKIVLPSDYTTRYKTILDSIGIQFLRIFFPDFPLNSLQKIVSSTSKIILGLNFGLNECFHKESMLDQVKQFFPCSSALVQLWKNAFPDIDQVKAIPMEAFEMMTSPWAPNIKDEDFVTDTFYRLRELVSGDLEIGKFLCLLSLFSPVNIDLSSEETACLKQFQSKISMMLYNHVLGQEGVDNASALEWVGKIGRIIEDLHKCGEILNEGVINNGDADIVENIDDIELVQL
eukprot:TRINITY_DN24045_c0_g1_i1.p1 TRINITY_DN24045_c0_g1~~TRINITY_DN24045_c0_g1_i1.p1  ORF type:complete len:419 (+),score=84.64 TRINITY_DN24045_c0_g1_i1:22-1257(+)